MTDAELDKLVLDMPHTGVSSSTALRLIARIRELEARDDDLSYVSVPMRPVPGMTFVRMTPEDHDLYLRILALRDEIGPVDFAVAQAIRETRDGE